MRLYQNFLASGAALLLALTGCGDIGHQTGPLEGRVIKEFGTLSRTSEAGEINKEQTYGIVLETEEATYTLGIDDSDTKPIFALEETIQPGDKVKVSGAYVHNDNVGTTQSEYVYVTEKANAEK